MIRAMRCIVAAIVVCVFLAAVGWVSARFPPPAGDMGAWASALLVSGVRGVITVAGRHPGAPVAVGIAVACWAIIQAVRTAGRAGAARDPVRMYTAAQRRDGFDRCQGRCERDGALPWTRCRRRAEHADHWYPWSKGGETSMGNLVGSCAWHNLSKSGSWPTGGETRRIARRRKRYWTGPEEERVPGRTYGGASWGG